MSKLDDSITGFVGHMVPPVRVKLIPCESYLQPGKKLGGAQKCRPTVRTYSAFFALLHNCKETKDSGLKLEKNILFKEKNGGKSHLEAIINYVFFSVYIASE